MARAMSVALSPALIPDPPADLEKRGPVLGRAEGQQQHAGAALDLIDAVGEVVVGVVVAGEVAVGAVVAGDGAVPVGDGADRDGAWAPALSAAPSSAPG